MKKIKSKTHEDLKKNTQKTSKKIKLRPIELSSYEHTDPFNKDIFIRLKKWARTPTEAEKKQRSNSRILESLKKIGISKI